MFWCAVLLDISTRLYFDLPHGLVKIPGEVLWEFLGGDVPLGPWNP